MFEDEGIRWRVDEVYFDEDVKVRVRRTRLRRQGLPPTMRTRPKSRPWRSCGPSRPGSIPCRIDGERAPSGYEEEDDRLDARQRARGLELLDALAARREEAALHEGAARL